mmetsp:Transcript_39118/g.66678  ORF Transcript_39118/g.66678 Transcript_39118/m.66678 type:complete len:189 (+) Transcript_39118:143-709(+)
MRRIRSFAAMSCFLQGNTCFSTFAGTPSLVPRYNALSAFAPELDESFGSDPWTTTVFSSSRELNSMPLAQRRRTFHGPPVDALYELEAQIPVIGKQVFQLKILSEGMASLVIEGLLELRDIIRYEVDGDGEFAFVLSESTNRILRKFRTRLVKVRYCSETDTPSVIVRPPLPTNIKLTLRRKALPVAS